MGADRTPPDGLLSGFGIIDARFTPDTLVAKGAGATDSAYTQAGAKTGVATPAATSTRMRLEVTGTQAEDGDLRVKAIRQGMPGVERAQLAWRNGTDTTSQWRGQDSLALVTGWDTLRWDNASVLPASVPHVVRLKSRNVVACGDQQTAAADYVHKLHVYSASAGTWVTRTVTPEDTVTDLGPTIVEIPGQNGARQLLYTRTAVVTDEKFNIDVYMSTDEFANASIAGRRILSDGLERSVTVGGNAYVVTPLQMRAAYNNGTVVLFWSYSYTFGGTTYYSMDMYASSDGGMAFDKIVEDWRTAKSEEAQSPDVIPMRGGGFLAAYRGATDYVCLKIDSAFQSPTASTVSISGYAVPARNLQPCIAMWADEDDVIYAVYRTENPVGGIVNHGLSMKRSIDGGADWYDNTDDPDFDRRIFNADGDYAVNPGTASFHSFGATSTGGRGIIVSRWDAATSAYDTQSLGVLYTGGFTSHTAPASERGYRMLDYIAWDYNAINGTRVAPGGLYLPIELPGNCTWTAAGAGTDSLTAGAGTTGYLEIATVGNTRTFTRTMATSLASDESGLYSRFCYTIPTTAQGLVTTRQIAAQWRYTDWNGAAATFAYEAYITLDRTAGDHLRMALWDLNPAGAAIQIGAVTTISTTATVAMIAIAIDSSGNVLTWYTTDTGPSAIWTAGPAGALTDFSGTVAAASEVSWGHFANTTSTTGWLYFGYNFWSGTWREGSTSPFASAWTNADIRGANIGLQPRYIASGVLLAATRGPAEIGDTWTCEALYDYSIDNLHPLTVASPAQVWRATGTAESRVVWQWSLAGYAQRWRNATLAIGVFNTNVRTLYLEGYNGATWDTIATIDGATGLTGLGYTAAEGGLAVNTGSPAATRYFWYDEFAGATVKMTDGVSTSYLVLEGNTEGEWRDSAEVKKPILYADGFTAAVPTIGTLDIYPQNFVHIQHNVTGANWRFIRIRVASQSTSASYHQIGTLAVTAVAAFGARYSFGWAVDLRAGAELLERPSGVTRSNVLGPPAREFTIAWDDAVLEADVLASSPSPGYVRGAAAGSIVGSRNDTLFLAQYLARAANGPDTPMLWLPRIPNTSQTLNNPEDFALVRVVSPVRKDNVRGRAASGMMSRIATVTLREER